jgi:hypothetical protein
MRLLLAPTRTAVDLRSVSPGALLVEISLLPEAVQQRLQADRWLTFDLLRRRSLTTAAQTR